LKEKVKPELGIRNEVNLWQAPVNPDLEQLSDLTKAVCQVLLCFSTNQLVALYRIMQLHIGD
jgi:hypothetical protein